jgi:hypothetical protein
MRVQGNRPVSGHVFRVPRKRGAQWYVKYRGPDGRQVQKRRGTGDRGDRPRGMQPPPPRCCTTPHQAAQSSAFKPVCCARERARRRASLRARSCADHSSQLPGS